MPDFDRYLAACEDRHAQRIGHYDDDREERMARESDAYAKMLNCPDYQRMAAGLPPLGCAYDDEGNIVDEYGRSSSHPDYGFLGPSIYHCPACQWTGDDNGAGICPKCHEEVGGIMRGQDATLRDKIETLHREWRRYDSPVTDAEGDLAQRVEDAFEALIAAGEKADAQMEALRQAWQAKTDSPEPRKWIKVYRSDSEHETLDNILGDGEGSHE